MYDVVALGELLVDFATQSTDEQGYPTMVAHPSGAPANFLAAITKFGGKTALLGKVGNDTFGRLLLHTLQQAGICADCGEPNGITFTQTRVYSINQHQKTTRLPLAAGSLLRCVVLVN